MSKDIMTFGKIVLFFIWFHKVFGVYLYIYNWWVSVLWPISQGHQNNFFFLRYTPLPLTDCNTSSGIGSCDNILQRNRTNSIWIYLYIYASVLSPQSRPTLCNPTEYSPPGSSVNGIFQARILEQVAISYCRVSSWPGDQTHIFCISCIGRQILYHWAPWEAHIDICICVHAC